VYNLAAQSVPADSWQQPIVTSEITALGPVRIMEALRSQKVDARFYQATSREIYGGVQQEVIDESTPLLANNPYGAAKLYAHLMVDIYRKSYGMFACGGILFNHESPRRSLHFVTRKVSMAVACICLDVVHPPLNEMGQPLVIDRKLKVGNLASVRDWGYAKEYVEAMWLMLQQDEPQDYIIATNIAYTVEDLCRVAFAHVGAGLAATRRDRRRLYAADRNHRRTRRLFKSQGRAGLEAPHVVPGTDRLMVDEDIRRLSHSAAEPAMQARPLHR